MFLIHSVSYLINFSYEPLNDKFCFIELFDNSILHFEVLLFIQLVILKKKKISREEYSYIVKGQSSREAQSGDSHI